MPAIVALMHDILITVGIYALLGREVTTATVAAVLTVLGYSIYDTIIIFDRIRENIPLMKRGSFRQITNVSLWETIPRSLATTFITLLPISALYFFGGETLKDFAFALLVGIGAGRTRRSSSQRRSSPCSRSASRSTLAASTTARSATPVRSAACCARRKSSPQPGRHPI